MNIIDKPCGAGNWRTGRGNQKVQLIVIHVMDGYLTGTDGLFATPPDQRKGALRGFASAAHYGIGQKGEVHRYVKDEDTAYHAGRVASPKVAVLAKSWDAKAGKYSGVNPNSISVGIEHEGTGDAAFAKKLKLSFEWPDAMMQASAELIATLCAKFALSIDRQHVVGHHEIFANKTCPGPLSIVDKLVAMASAVQLPLAGE